MTYTEFPRLPDPPPENERVLHSVKTGIKFVEEKKITFNIILFIINYIESFKSN